MHRVQRPAAAFLLAFSGLLAELAWTRITGLLFFGESAFLVVSWAVAGLSLGAALGAVRPGLLRRPVSAASGVAAGAASAAGLAVVLLAAGRGGVGLALAAIVPSFAAFGLALAGVFAGDPRHAPRIYAADLAGAALGAIASLPALSLLGAPDALLLAAAGAAGAGVVLAAGAGRGAQPGTVVRGQVAAGTVAAGTVAAALLLLVAAPGPDADPHRWATPKSIVAELDRGGELLQSRWGSVGRSDLVRRADGAEVLYLDGGAGSLVPTPGSAELWRGDLGRFAFEALQPERVFVVGGGAGLEAAHALETGALEVVVAEVNRAGTALARERLAALRSAQGSEDGPPADAPGDPFSDPRVRWVGDEARAVLRASGGGYDLITLSQAVTRTAEARGLALTENGIYTVEATRGWLASLAPGGAVAYELYDELTLTRVLTTVGTALVEMGAARDDAAALDRMVLLLDPIDRPADPAVAGVPGRPGPRRGRGDRTRGGGWRPGAAAPARTARESAVGRDRQRTLQPGVAGRGQLRGGHLPHAGRRAVLLVVRAAVFPFAATRRDRSGGADGRAGVGPDPRLAAFRPSVPWNTAGPGRRGAAGRQLPGARDGVAVARRAAPRPSRGSAGDDAGSAPGGRGYRCRRKSPKTRRVALGVRRGRRGRARRRGVDGGLAPDRGRRRRREGDRTNVGRDRRADAAGRRAGRAVSVAAAPLGRPARGRREPRRERQARGPTRTPARSRGRGR
ncbi:MAG: hypothetical protein U5J97_11585 [Trueperaceae bacterium]|nr:hypothetical protein [Trueperaceae bacterium]